jgi:hypothetical protein
LKDAKSPNNPTINIVDIRTDYTFEVGSNKNRLHVHGVVDLTHNGHYQLDQQKIRMIISKYTGSSMHLDIQAQRSASAVAWERYMSKSLPTNN